jgi:DNA-binding transcriptional LysR family regulator
MDGLAAPQPRGFERMMKLELIKSFSVLGEVSNYGEAARRLGISQPSLTKQIMRLEDLIGARLFHRTRQGTELSAFGRQFLAEILPVIEHAERAWEYGMQGARGQRGLIAFGFTFSAADVMTNMVIAFRSRFPEVELSFNDISSRTQIGMIQERQLDLGFIRMPASPDLRSMKVATDRLAFVYPAKMADQIGDFDSIVSTDLPFIGLQIGKAPGTEFYIQRLFSSRKYRPKTTHRVNESQTQLTLVSAGLGFTLMHESALSRIIDYGGGVIVRPVTDEIARWDVGLVWRNGEINPAVKQFIKVAQAHIVG